MSDMKLVVYSKGYIGKYYYYYYHHPRTNGKLESLNKLLKRMLTKYLLSKPIRKWDLENITILSSLWETPSSRQQWELCARCLYTCNRSPSTNWSSAVSKATSFLSYVWMSSPEENTTRWKSTTSLTQCWPVGISTTWKTPQSSNSNGLNPIR